MSQASQWVYTGSCTGIVYCCDRQWDKIAGRDTLRCEHLPAPRDKLADMTGTGSGRPQEEEGEAVVVGAHSVRSCPEAHATPYLVLRHALSALLEYVDPL